MDTVIPVKVAVQRALDYVADLYSEKLTGTSLEEVELSEDDRYWLVTVGVQRPDNDLRAVLNPGGTWTYKIVKVDAKTGEGVSMKNYDVATLP